jgi:hypothetical protein
MMKERFAKLLLGEDMSGSGKGVCTALAISNAVTNLCGTIRLATIDLCPIRTFCLLVALDQVTIPSALAVYSLHYWTKSTLPSHALLSVRFISLDDDIE